MEDWMTRSSNEFPKASEPKVVEQAGALCLRVNVEGVTEVLMVGSRRNGR